MLTFIIFELKGTKSYKYICLVLGGKDICLYISKPQYTNMQISSGCRGSCLMCGESCTKHPSLMCHMDWQYCYQTTPPLTPTSLKVGQHIVVLLVKQTKHLPPKLH